MVINLFVWRPVTVLRKSVPTVIDSILKIGGLLGFIRLFSIGLGFTHRRLFIGDLKRKFEGTPTEQYEGIQTDASVVLVKQESRASN